MKKEYRAIGPDINLIGSLLKENRITGFGKYQVGIDIINQCEKKFEENLIQKKHFQTLIYIGQYHKRKFKKRFTSSLSTNGDKQFKNSKEDTGKYNLEVKDISNLYELKRLIEIFKNGGNQINLISLTWKYTDKNVLKNIQILSPSIIAELINVLPEKHIKKTHDSLKEAVEFDKNYPFDMGVTKFRKLMAECLKLYFDDNHICNKVGVETTSKQLRLIHFIMEQFEVIDSETYSDDVNSIRSLLKTPFKF